MEKYTKTFNVPFFSDESSFECDDTSFECDDASFECDDTSFECDDGSFECDKRTAARNFSVPLRAMQFQQQIANKNNHA